MKTGRTMVACAVGGHQRFAEAGGLVGATAGQISVAVVLPGLQGRPCAAKEAFLLS